MATIYYNGQNQVVANGRDPSVVGYYNVNQPIPGTPEFNNDYTQYQGVLKNLGLSDLTNYGITAPTTNDALYKGTPAYDNQSQINPPQDNALQGQTQGLQSQNSSSNPPQMSTQQPPQMPQLGQPSYSPSNSIDQYLQNYLQSLAPTQAENDLQGQQASLANQARMLALGQQSTNNQLDNQPIARPFITGQQATVAKDYALQNQTNSAQQQTVTQQLALEQAKRQSGIDVNKAMLDYQTHLGDQQFQAQQQQLQNDYNAAQNQYKLQYGQYSQDLQNQFNAQQQALQNQFTASQNTQSQQATASNNAANNAADLAKQQALIAGQNQYITLPAGSQLINTQAGQGSSATPGVSYPTTNLQPGDTGANVTQLQKYLGVPATGNYDSATMQAVMALQQKLGVDNSSGPGYFGPKTIAALSKGGSNVVAANPTAKNQGVSSSTADAKEIASFQSDASKYIEDLGANKVSWATAWNALHAKYPSASNALIDQTLNKNQYYTVTGQ